MQALKCLEAISRITVHQIQQGLTVASLKIDDGDPLGLIVPKIARVDRWSKFTEAATALIGKIGFCSDIEE
jgi:hypothetical protein